MSQIEERKAVAEWAQYCMGSCHGDWAPQTEAIYGEVMRDDAVFEFYRRTFYLDRAARDSNEQQLKGK